jgi:hypothetical protein
MKADNLCGYAFDSAMNNVIKIINRYCNTSLTYEGNWEAIENIANELGISFDANGEIIKED